MKLHADLMQRAALDSERLAWIDSPMPGVQRRMLDRDGDEVARATSLVRYAPGSHFSAHAHGGGEEILVLEGVFSDEHGDFGPGVYLRNPVGSRHTPASEPGCTILVKLWQMDPEDQAQVRIDTRAREWTPGEVAGVDLMPLHAWRGERVALHRWAPGARLAAHEHDGGEEILVLDGSFADEHGHHRRGTWVRSPHGSSHAPFTETGCLLYVKVGHLPRGPGPRAEDAGSGPDPAGIG